MPLYPSLKTFKVFVNLKKTFDTIDHKILIGKLEHYGVRSIAKDWLCSYLVNRKQFVSLNKNNSTIQTISTVVPQASFLGHLLFLFTSMTFTSAQNIPNLMILQIKQTSDCMFFVMSHTCFRVDPHSLVAWMSRNSLLKADAESEV